VPHVEVVERPLANQLHSRPALPSRGEGPVLTQSVATVLGHERRYTIALCKGAALLDETRSLLKHWVPGEEIDEFVDRIQRENALGKATAYRTKDIVRRVFVRRFLATSDAPARRLKRIVERGLSRKLFVEVLFLHAARADALLYDFAVGAFWPTSRRGRLTFSMPEVRDFLTEAAADGRIPQAWSATVQRKVARTRGPGSAAPAISIGMSCRRLGGVAGVAGDGGGVCRATPDRIAISASCGVNRTMTSSSAWRTLDPLMPLVAAFSKRGTTRRSSARFAINSRWIHYRSVLDEHRRA